MQPGTKGPGGLSILPLSRSVSDPAEFVGYPHFMQVHSPHTWQNQGCRPFNNSLCALCRIVFVHLSFSPHTTRYLFDTSSNLTDWYGYFLLPPPLNSVDNLSPLNFCSVIRWPPISLIFWLQKAENFLKSGPISYYRDSILVNSHYSTRNTLEY